MVLRERIGLAHVERVVDIGRKCPEVGNAEARIRSPECRVIKAEKLTNCKAIQPRVWAGHSR